MKTPPGTGSLKPVFAKPSKAEQKIDATTRLVRSIVDADAAKRHAKTERLRAERLHAELVAREAVAGSETETKKPKRPSRRKMSKSS